MDLNSTLLDSIEVSNTSHFDAFLFFFILEEIRPIPGSTPVKPSLALGCGTSLQGALSNRQTGRGGRELVAGGQLGLSRSDYTYLMGSGANHVISLTVRVNRFLGDASLNYHHGKDVFALEIN